MKAFVVLALLVLPIASRATTWLVGPSRTYTKPSEVMALVQDGDTVRVDAGVYSGDVGAWRANNLVILGSYGASGYAHLDANGNAAEGKAIWVVKGSNTLIEGFEFSGCTVVDANGAGIRQEGTNVTIRHCYFHDNENGILTGANESSTVTIEFSEFARNGHGDGQSHNMYIGKVKDFRLRYCYVHHAKVGHQVKSRAISNEIMYNAIQDEAEGNASYEIDLPNGGLATIMGNVIMKGRLAENRTMISYGEEGITNNGFTFTVAYNTIVSERSRSTAIRAYGSNVQTLIVGANIVAGTDSLYDISKFIPQIGRDHWDPDTAVFHFRNSRAFDYHLVIADTDTRLPAPMPFMPLPTVEYKHPMDSTARSTAVFTHGAFGADASLSVVDTRSAITRTVAFFPNPALAGSAIQVVLPMAESESEVRALFYSTDGRLLLSTPVRNGAARTPDQRMNGYMELVQAGKCIATGRITTH